ncbi:DUF2933 domain-containing protein [Dethiothermospora halolimnae]|uniref:DUF2933 domain-containing protein n=1 Tax=Dethiothermospora halolimnae TaxID=3114390 RepID=UPI003CCC2A8B
MAKNKGHKNHMLLMLLGCLAPILIIFAVRGMNISLGSGSIFYWLLFLLCPLMHIFMMKGMRGHGNGCKGEETEKKEIAEYEE